MASFWDSLTGLLKDAATGPIGQNIVGGALGAARGAAGGPVDVSDYWAGIDAGQKKKATRARLESLSKTLGVPVEELELRASPEGALLDAYKPKYEISEHRMFKIPPGGGEPEVVQEFKQPVKPGKPFAPPARATSFWNPATNQFEPIPEQFRTPGAPPKEKEPSPIGSIPGASYINEKGELYPDPTGTKADATRAGYRAVPEGVVKDVQLGQQSLTMLNNMAQTFDTLQAKGKMIGPQGLGALWDRANLRWKEISGDEDLAVAQAQQSDMVAIMRGLGDKGVRAIQAFEGAMNLLSSGKAPYTAVRRYLMQIDQALRAGAPKQAPKAFDGFEGARQMGKGREYGLAAAPSLTASQQRIVDEAPDGDTFTLSDGKTYVKKGGKLVLKP